VKAIEGAQVIQAKGAIEGMCSDKFAPVREVFAYNLGSGQDIGYVPNRWITGAFEQHRSANVVRAAYQALQG